MGCSDSLMTRPLIVPVCACAATAAPRRRGRTTYCNERIRMRNSWVGGVHETTYSIATSRASMHVTSPGVKLVHANLRAGFLLARQSVSHGDGYLIRAGGCVSVMKRDFGRASPGCAELIATRVRVINLKSDEASALGRHEKRDCVARRGDALVRRDRHAERQRVQRRLSARRGSKDDDECQQRSSHFSRPGRV